MRFQLPPALSVLRNRDFRLYWIGQAISLCGTWMQIMAQGWVVTGLSDSARTLGALNVTSLLPMLLLSVLGGTLADRFEKRQILILTQIGMMLLAFVLAGLLFSHRLELWHIFALALLAGIVTAFDLPAAQAFPPELVLREEIPKAVALVQAIFHGSRLVGPALAGILVARFGEGSAFLGNGISFLFVIAMLLAIPNRHAPGKRPHRRGGVTDGFRYVRQERLVGSLIALTGLTTTFVFPFIAVLLVYYVRHVLLLNAQGMGTLMSTSGLGALAGAVMLLKGSEHTVRRWLAAGILGCGAGLVGLAFARSEAVAIPLILVLSFSVSSLMGRVSQTIQHVVPNELRGRVMAVFSMAFTGLMPFAAMGLSALADRIGFGRVMLSSAVTYLTASLALLTRVPAPSSSGSRPDGAATAEAAPS